MVKKRTIDLGNDIEVTLVGILAFIGVVVLAALATGLLAIVLEGV